MSQPSSPINPDSESHASGSNNPGHPRPASQAIPPVQIQSLSGNTPRENTTAGVPSPIFIPQAPAEVPVPTAQQLPLSVKVETQNHLLPRPHLPEGSEPKKNVLAEYWRKAGGGSFMVSLTIHAGLLFGAYFVVDTIVHDKKIDFLPGGGSKQGQDASQQVTQTVQTKRRDRLQESLPKQRITASNPTAAIKLPDMPMESVSVPSVSSLLSGGSMGSGGFGSSGLGGGLGNGVGSGNVKGFFSRTVFGRMGGEEGLPGRLYDFKQDRNRKPLEYTPAMYGPALAKAAERRFSPTSLRDYYCAKQHVNFSFLVIPNMKAEEGPKAFKVEQEVEPRGWFVHYQGTISPPTTGEWRFIGLFDDVLIVYINNKVVFDGGYAFFSAHGQKDPDQEVRQEFGTDMFGPKYKTRVGKWVNLKGPAKIDIIVGEVPGASVGGALLVQHKDTTYQMRANGTPILPVFSTVKPDMEDIATIRKFAKATKFEIAEETPVFTVRKSALENDEGMSGRSSLLPPK